MLYGQYRHLANDVAFLTAHRDIAADIAIDTAIRASLPALADIMDRLPSPSDIVNHGRYAYVPPTTEPYAHVLASRVAVQAAESWPQAAALAAEYTTRLLLGPAIAAMRDIQHTEECRNAMLRSACYVDWLRNNSKAITEFFS
jgi:hypothetical protein